MASARVKPTSAFRDRIAQAGFSYAQLSKESGVSKATIRAIITPSHHPWRRGPLFRVTAWKIARAYARATGTTEEAAFSVLFDEIETTNPALAVA